MMTTRQWSPLFLLLTVSMLKNTFLIYHINDKNAITLQAD